MEKKPRNSMMKLLSEPGFDFTPYFDQAVIEWLERNMDGFLEKAPEAVKYFIQDKDRADIVARHIPITPEGEPDLLRFMGGLTTDWNHIHALYSLVPRLVTAGKMDLVIHCADTFKQIGWDLISAMNSFSDEGVRTIFNKIDLRTCRWSLESRCAFIERLPADLIVQIDTSSWQNIYNEKERTRVVAVMAKKWPLENIGEFLQRYGARYDSLFCMACYEKHPKSKPGYTLHRKVCDPENKFPNIWTTVAQRAR
jgi:hypothetical protein